MIQVERPELKIKRNNYQFTFTCLQASVSISIVCHQSFSKYTTNINESYIQNNKNLDFFFGSPKELYQYFVNSFDGIQFTKNGQLLFMLQTNMGSVVRKYECKIVLQKQQIQGQNVMKLKLGNLNKQIDYLKEQNHKLKSKIGEIQQVQEKLKNKMAQFQKILISKDQIINTIFHQIKQLQAWKDQKQKIIQDFITNKRKFVPDQLNTHLKKFIQIGNRFKKNGGGSWDVLLCKNFVQKNEVYKYNIKQIRAGSNGSFMYGVGTDVIRSMNRAQDSKQFIGYYENTGNIYEGGQSKKGGPKIKDGQTITVEIDTKKWKIIWYIEGKKQAESNIGPEIRVKNIHLAIIVFNDESQIQFI